MIVADALARPLRKMVPIVSATYLGMWAALGPLQVSRVRRDRDAREPPRDDRLRRARLRPLAPPHSRLVRNHRPRRRPRKGIGSARGRQPRILDRRLLLHLVPRYDARRQRDNDK